MSEQTVTTSDQLDTRSRILEVALRLFTEQGYEKTSLREIAEELGVTKAALYYHFRTKEDIVVTMVADRAAFVDELIEWLRDQPRTLETRREAVRKYAEGLFRGHHHAIMHFIERNQATMKNHPGLANMRQKMMSLTEMLLEPGMPLAARLKRSMALFSVHAVWFLLPDCEAPEEERLAACLEVALELVSAE